MEDPLFVIMFSLMGFLVQAEIRMQKRRASSPGFGA